MNMTEAHACILLVEDDPGTARLAHRRLQEAGYRVLVAQSPAEALELLRAHRVDLILLDYRLPGATGLDFYLQLKASGHELPAIMMTGFSDERTVIAALRAGMRDFIPKVPEFIEYLPEAVERVLRQLGLEHRLEGSEQRLAGIIRAATDAIITFEADGRINLFNPAAERMFGCAAAAMLGQPIERLILADIDWLCRSAQTNPGAGHIELSARRCSGEEFSAEAACFAVRTGGQAFTTLILSDVSERKRLEAERIKLLREQAARSEAESASRAKDLFLATLSHELRTPLAAVLGWVRLLRSGKLDDEQTSRAIATIERNVELQVTLIEDMLDISRIVSGKLQLEQGTLDLGTLLSEAVEGARQEAEAKGLAFVLGVPPESVCVEGDRQRLKQVLANLIANALKFTPRGGRVALRLERLAAVARIVVEDSGIGIDPALLPHVFEPFRQGIGGVQRREGLGLGLSIVRLLVERHGGRIVAESAGRGKGARFIVELPLACGATEPDVAAPTGALECSLDGLRVLVVDDDDDSRELVRFVLAARGAEVSSAAGLGEALSIVRAAAMEVVVTDLAMPGGDGYALLRALREIEERTGRRPAATLAFTAHASDHDRERAFRAGFQTYIAKPVDPFELVQAVSQYLQPGHVDH